MANFEIGILVDIDKSEGYFEEEQTKYVKNQINDWVGKLKSLPDTEVQSELFQSELGLYELVSITTIGANIATIATLIITLLKMRFDKEITIRCNGKEFILRGETSEKELKEILEKCGE